ncbi:MAG TPA: ROK family glucokinase [Actinomycetaceae bacterium]|nr:ROK family glucokinase [Actinomycetaceae bacterium]
MLTIGVDVGGTKIAAGVVDEQGRIVARTRISTQADESELIVEGILASIAELRRTHDVGSAGVVVPGMVAPTRDVVLFSPNVAWRNFPLRDRLTESLDIPVVIENDANAAGWAEFRFGVGQDVRHMVLMTLGTGVGGAIVVDGQLLRGAFGAAGEIGHLKMVPHGHYCGCGHEGCLERYASGRAITLAARHRVVTDPEGARRMTELAGRGRKIKGPHVTAAAAEGDPTALEILDELGYWTGMACASLAAVLDPELIVIGGGVAESGELFIDSVRDGYLDHLSARGFREEARIELALLGNDAGIVGAADLARI